MTDEAKALVRPIIGIEYRTPQEVFDIMCDRFAYRNAVIETQAREIERLRGALKNAEQAISEYYRYWTGGEMRGSYDGEPERSNLWKAKYETRAALAGTRSARQRTPRSQRTQEQER